MPGADYLAHDPEAVAAEGRVLTERLMDVDRKVNAARKPSIGRIVLYNHPGSADGVFKASQSPGIVQGVNDDGSIDLVVFSRQGGLFFNKRIVQGDGAQQWQWPALV